MQRIPWRPGLVEAESSPGRGTVASVVVHAAVLLAVLGVLHRAVRIEPYKLPGTRNGVELLTYYDPGSAVHAPATQTVKKAAPVKPVAAVKAVVVAPQVVETQAASVETGEQSSALSGIGDGNLSLALEKYFPYPRPDLSALPHGTRGDVVLDAMVDKDGRIAELTLVQGLGSPVDDQVIATVKQWSYTPATRNGVPVASKQELHFHYERG